MFFLLSRTVNTARLLWYDNRTDAENLRLTLGDQEYQSTYITYQSKTHNVWCLKVLSKAKWYVLFEKYHQITKCPCQVVNWSQKSHTINPSTLIAKKTARVGGRCIWKSHLRTKLLCAINAKFTTNYVAGAW